jgi:protein SCO1/2
MFKTSNRQANRQASRQASQQAGRRGGARVGRRALVAAPVVAALLAACGRKAQSFNGIDITGADYGRDFRLRDPDGRERTLADFRGRCVLLFFGFTQCPDVCPTALSRAAEVRRLLGADADKLQVIFVTIDPERDTPAVLRGYTANFDPTFVGLYGDAQQTGQAAKDFRVFYQKVPTGNSYTMDHTALTYAFDPSGRLRLALRHDLSAEQVAADLRVLMQLDSN